MKPMVCVARVNRKRAAEDQSAPTIGFPAARSSEVAPALGRMKPWMRSPFRGEALLDLVGNLLGDLGRHALAHLCHGSRHIVANEDFT
jgi:hypothetical protein